MSGLFDDIDEAHQARIRPLAERSRPHSINDVVGQLHLLGPGGPLRAFVERGVLPSIILWGPPGTGKTTLANALAATFDAPMERLSAVEHGVKDLREILGRAQRKARTGVRMIVFIDEIHRFTKAQQDALLHAVEQGTITLIGATTENPSFEVNAALLSRCHVYRLHALSTDELISIVRNALESDPQLRELHVSVQDWQALITVSGGDARAALNAIETAAYLALPDASNHRLITRELLQQVVQRRIVRYDKSGEQHYDIVSAFIKSVRGSDVNAALLWLAAMIEAGEDPLFIARRMIILASEDIGNADPHALPLTLSVFQAVERIGMPEGRIPLAQGVVYLAKAPKSNASYKAIDAALQAVRSGIDLTVPLHLRNAATGLLSAEGYGEGYKYPHDFEGGRVQQQYFPDGVDPISFYDEGAKE
ncbi:MAG: replication-associated recombination protein A [Candidatus Kapabacteria bacterium]|nr:replication-associated recombination protein A [Candidatus Kapabacteria bacterium]